jgi:hypothetical protein
MARESWLVLVAIAAACSTKASPPASRTEDRPLPPRADKRVEAKADGSVTPVALAPEVLPGWRFRSADEGWWSAAGDEQLFVSHVDLGNLAAGKSAAERAQLLAKIYSEAHRRQGATSLAVASDALAARLGRPVACTTAVSVSDHAHAFSCGLARDTGPALGIEYTSYRNDALDSFNARAETLIASIAAVAN